MMRLLFLLITTASSTLAVVDEGQRHLRHSDGGSTGGGIGLTKPPPPPPCNPLPGDTDEDLLLCWYNSCIECYAGDEACAEVLGTGCHGIQHCYDHGENCGRSITDLCRVHNTFCEMDFPYVTQTLQALLPDRPNNGNGNGNDNGNGRRLRLNNNDGSGDSDSKNNDNEGTGSRRDDRPRH